MSLTERIRSMMKPIVYQISLSSDAPTQVLNYTAKKLYQSQDNLQAVVNFMANSIAQLPIKVYKRDGETDRVRDRDGVAAKLLWKPNADETSYEFIRALSLEYFVFGCVFVWVTPDKDSQSGYQMRIIPSEWVTEKIGGTIYAPDAIRVSTKNGMYVEIPRSEFVCFKTYSPGNPGGYISPISGLRQTLQEQIEAGNFRKQLWHSSGRLNAQIIRPKDVQPWDDEARKRFIEAFRKGWGSGGEKAGSIPLLEDGMEIKPFSTSFKESQWAESVKLSRESVAAAYSINPSLVWHSDTQTYASSKDNARALYAECLGPIIQMLQQRFNSFLLPMVEDNNDLYVEFDLTEKLKGSFEERAAILQAAVGGPYMTRNEARADNNLPAIEGGDELIVPMNVNNGFDNPAVDEAEPEPEQEEPKHQKIVYRKSESQRIKARIEEREAESIDEALTKFFKRQSESVLPKIGAGKDDWWDKERWDKELKTDLEPLIDEIADLHGIDAAEIMDSEYNTDITRNYLEAMTRARAQAINKRTYQNLVRAITDAAEEIEDADTPADVFDKRGNDALKLATSLVAAAAGFALVEAGNQAERQDPKKIVEKIWVTGANARESHALMDGEKVGINETFSNGARWPGDDNLDPDESCGCNCTTEVLITEV